MSAASLANAHADPAQEDLPVRDGDLIRLVALAPVRRDHALPILIAVSLMVHATIILPSLMRRGGNVPTVPHEIPVEIVQLPPKAAQKPPPPKPPTPTPEAPKRHAVKPQPSKPQQPKSQQPKPQQPKSQQPKPQQPKPQQPKPQQPKPQSPRREAAKREAAKPPGPKPAPPKPQRAAEKLAPKPEPASVSDRMRQLLGAMPAIALPGASADGTDEVSYAQLVLSKVAKAKKEGRYAGSPGATSVTFTLGDSGEVASVSIVRPSGEQWLDDEAMAMIRRAAPFPPPPPGGRRDFTITLRFEPVI